METETMKVHLAEPNGRGGFIAVCGAASWESLTRLSEYNECWECSTCFAELAD